MGKRAVEEANQAGSGEAAFAKCGVTSKTEVDALVQQRSTGGGGRCACKQCGINVPRLLVDPAGKEELTEEVWDKVFAVNVKGQFLFAQAAPVKCSPVVEAV